MDSPGGSTFSGLTSAHTQRSQRLYQRFLTDAAVGLTFSPDAGTDRVLYIQADYNYLFRPTGVLRPAAKRRLYRPAPMLNHRQAPQELPAYRWLPRLLDSSESASHPPPQRRRLLQDSCRGTRETEVKPVHKVAHKTHIVLNDSKSRHLQRRPPPGPEGHAHTHQQDVTTESLDQDQDQDQDQTRRPQSDSSGSGADSCVAAQCVVLDGDHRGVIQRLLAQLFQEDQPPRSQDQPPDVQLVVSQLIFLSSQMTLVRSLVAERLNSSEPEGRLVACRTLCGLRGPLNKDVVHKLTHLMWSDLSERVRLAAADALIKLGKEQNVHRHLRVKLEDGRGLQDRVEALELISSLKLTTAKLLESLVSCFKDESPAVRKQACVAAASLLLKDETVVSRLLELLENDPAREVRLSAIEAVGALGLSSADVQETLQSYVETEEDAELREAACRLLPVDNLHDFLLLDPECNSLVCRTITETLQEERCNARFISLQVKRLCEGRIIADKVLLLEKLRNEKHKGRRLQRRVLCRLMSLLYRTDLYQTPDDP